MDKGRFSSIFASAIVVGLVAWMIPGSASAFFSAPLVECQSVTQPTTLTNCGTDPLVRGVASIDESGSLDVVLVGAGASETYAVVFRSPDGTQSVSLGMITTDGNGNKSRSDDAEFALGKMGAGNIVLTRNGNDQYVTGIAIQATQMAPHSGPDFHAHLMSCKQVNVFTNPLPNCGTDAFKGGSVEIESNSGDVSIQINGGAANASYVAVLRSANGGSQSSLGTITTNKRGDGQLLPNSTTLPFGFIGSGTVALTRSGADQAVGGFQVSERPNRRAAKSSLVRCIDVNFPSAATPSNCGVDPLESGGAVLLTNGKLAVGLRGAAPSTTYEVFFRPINTSGAADMDTGISLTTDENGDAKGTHAFGAGGDVGSGDFVVQSGGFDEFLTGFTIK